jgi:hypothetical protein
MNKDLKKAIIDFMFENEKVFGLNTHTRNHFKQYVYTPEGEYCFGGEVVSNFISDVEKLITL